MHVKFVICVTIISNLRADFFTILVVGWSGPYAYMFVSYVLHRKSTFYFFTFFSSVIRVQCKQIFKTLLNHSRMTFKLLHSEFSAPWSSQKYVPGFLNFHFAILRTVIPPSPLYEGKLKCQISNEGGIRMKQTICVYCYMCIWGTFDCVACNFILGSFTALFFQNAIFKKVT